MKEILVRAIHLCIEKEKRNIGILLINDILSCISHRAFLNLNITIINCHVSRNANSK